MTDEIETISVGPFLIPDASKDEVIDEIARVNPSRARFAFALHVGGLNSRYDDNFVASMLSADVVYPDGVAVCWIAKVNGGRRVMRAATTDIGIDVLKRLADRVDTPLRVAIVGGPVGLAERAGFVIKEQLHCDIVGAVNGYEASYDDELQAWSAEGLDVLIVGMGMPREAIWAVENCQGLHGTLVLTCGGWLGFLAGEERRAPSWMRSAGLEWLFRLKESPRRLLRRYLEGSVSTASLLTASFASRFLSRRS